MKNELSVIKSDQLFLLLTLAFRNITFIQSESHLKQIIL